MGRLLHLPLLGLVLSFTACNSRNPQEAAVEKAVKEIFNYHLSAIGEYEPTIHFSDSLLLLYNEADDMFDWKEYPWFEANPWTCSLEGYHSLIKSLEVESANERGGVARLTIQLFEDDTTLVSNLKVAVAYDSTKNDYVVEDFYYGDSETSLKKMALDYLREEGKEQDYTVGRMPNEATRRIVERETEKIFKDYLSQLQGDDISNEISDTIHFSAKLLEKWSAAENKAASVPEVWLDYSPWTNSQDYNNPKITKVQTVASYFYDTYVVDVFIRVFDTSPNDVSKVTVVVGKNEIGEYVIENFIDEKGKYLSMKAQRYVWRN